jgi:DNA-binding beta-propeller fold protein YncE
MFNIHPTSIRSCRTAVALIAVLVVGLVSPVAVQAKKKKQTEAAKAESKPKLDISKLVWPEPPSLPRVRYTNYFAGVKLDYTADNKKPKQGWMDRLAGAQSQDEKVTKKNFPYQLLGPYGMAVDSKNRLYVADEKVGAVFVFNTETRETELIRNGFEAHFGMINAIAVDDNDRVFVSDGKLGKVLVFDANHKAEAQINEGLVDPLGLAIDTERRLLYVVDTKQDVVLVYDADSLKPLRKIGTPGKKHTLTGAGEFSLPTNIALDKEGNVYVTDSLNFRVEIFDAEGSFISQFGQHCDAIGCFERPKGIAVDSDGHIWVVDTNLALVEIFNRDGELLAYVGGPGRSLGRFNDPMGIAIDKNNRVFVSEQYPWGRVQQFRYITDAESAAMKAEREKSAGAAQKDVEKDKVQDTEKVKDNAQLNAQVPPVR